MRVYVLMVVAFSAVGYGQACRVPESLPAGIRFLVMSGAGGGGANVSSCTAGSELPRGGHCRVECDAGFMQDRGQHAGFSCSANATNITTDLPQCTVCALGRYGESPGASSCAECPAHSSTPAAGASSVHQCECDSGYEGSIKAADDVCLGRLCSGLPPALQAARGLQLVSDSNAGSPRHFPSVVQLACKDQSRHVVGDSSWNCDNTTGVYMPVHDPAVSAADVGCSEPSKIAHCRQDEVHTEYRWLPSGCGHWLWQKKCTQQQITSTCQKCDDGYTKAGFSGVSECVALSCLKRNVTHGVISYLMAGQPTENPAFSGTAISPSTTAVCTCKSGYILTYNGATKAESAPQICSVGERASTTWEGAAPECVATCRVPPSNTDLCVNSRSCFDKGGDQKAVCVCKTGWQGELCADDVDECEALSYDAGCVPIETDGTISACDASGKQCTRNAFAVEDPLQCDLPYWMSASGHPSRCDRSTNAPFQRLTSCSNMPGSWSCGACQAVHSCCNSTLMYPPNISMAGLEHHRICNSSTDGNSGHCSAESAQWNGPGCTAIAAATASVETVSLSPQRCKHSGDICSCSDTVTAYPQSAYDPKRQSTCVVAGSRPALTISPRDSFGRLSAENSVTSAAMFNISVLAHPLRKDGRACMKPFSPTAWSVNRTGWVYLSVFRCDVAGSYELSVKLTGGHIQQSPQQITIVPDKVQPSNTLAFLAGSAGWCVASDAELEQPPHCRTMPGRANQLLVRVRDRFGNERRKYDVNADDAVQWSSELAVSHKQHTAARKALWDDSAGAYGIGITFDSDEHREFFVNLTVNGERWEQVDELSDWPQLHVVSLWANIRFNFAVYTNINTLACMASKCALDSRAEHRSEVCSKDGCLFSAGHANKIAVFLDWQPGTEVHVAVNRTCDEQPDETDGILAQYYWQRSNYCFDHGFGWNASKSRRASDTIVVTQPHGKNGLLSTVQVAHPGIFAVIVTLDAVGLPPVNYTTRVSIGPGPSSPSKSSVQTPKVIQPTIVSGSPTLSVSKHSPYLDAVLGGEVLEFQVQAADERMNVCLAIDEIFVEVSRVLPMTNPLLGHSSQYQPDRPFALAAVTEGICTKMGCDMSNSSATSPELIPYGSLTTGQYTFNLALLEYGIFSVSVWICPPSHLDECRPESPVRHTRKIGVQQVFTVCPQNSNYTSAHERQNLTVNVQLDNCFCKRGFIGATSGHGETCKACLRGKYAPETGLTRCTDCDVGKSCGCRGGGASVDPTNCSLLSWEPACSSCPPCSPNTYQNRLGQPSCRKCTEGFSCEDSAMTYQLATPGFWVSQHDPRDAYPCVPDLACPGSSLTLKEEKRMSQATREQKQCFQSEPPKNGWLPNSICNDVVGARCALGFTGNKCSRCCRKANQGDTSCDGNRWYRTNKLCLPCKQQSALLVSGLILIIAAVVGPIAFKISQIARHLGALQGPLMSAMNFFRKSQARNWLLFSCCFFFFFMQIIVVHLTFPLQSQRLLTYSIT